MLGPVKSRRLDRPVTVTLESLVPPGHFYRHLERSLDLTFVRDLAAETYKLGGRPSIDPIVFFKLQLIMFFEGTRSERLLLEIAGLHLAHRWYLGYALDERLPDHSSLTKIRQRYGLAIFGRFFERVVDLCQEAGLVWGKELFFDATKVRADADVDSLLPRFYLDAKARAGAHVAELFAGDPVGPEPGGAEEPRAAPDAQPEAPPAERLPTPATPGLTAELAEANRSAWKLLDERRLDPRRPPEHGYQRLSGLRASTTDPDAALMRHEGRMLLGYHDHYVVDGGKARIILAALVTPADVMENTPMLDLLRRVRFRWRLRPERAVGDTTYGTAENIRALEEAGIRAYVPLPDWGQRTPYYGASRFTYDAERDEYRCPRGQALRRHAAKYTEGVVAYRADAATCNACPVKAACTASGHGRQVTRSFHAEYLERVRGYHQTAAYAKAMRKRAVWVEPLFGEAKGRHNLRRFRLRGLDNANIEGLLVAAGQNLKRLLAATGWARRPAPCGRLRAAPSPL